MENPENLRKILLSKVPESSVEYCIQLWNKEPFSFVVSKSRKTKLGDFRFRRDRTIQTITINNDLNIYQFLITYIHEVAHLHAFSKFGHQIPPHGLEWKSLFQELMNPMLTPWVFPRDILVPLQRHMKAPKASSTRDLFLMKELSKYDLTQEENETLFLSDLRPGSNFILSGRKFKKGETRRTRVLCEEIPSGKKYLIAQMAKVKSVS